MTKGQRKLADYILQNSQDMAFLTSAELSSRTGVSEATIIRFFRFLGFTGFSDFKESLQQSIKNKITPTAKMKETVEKIKNKENVFTNLLNIDRAMLDEVAENCLEQNIQSAVQYIKKAKRIFIIGLGVSKAVADFLEFRLHRLKYTVVTITGGGEEVVDKLMSCTGDDVVIGTGFFRTRREVMVAFDIVRQKNTPRIAITDSYSSPLANNSDVVLYAPILSLPATPYPVRSFR